MFSGIVQEVGKILSVVRQKGAPMRYSLSSTFEPIQPGASVSVDGVCQTVVHAEKGLLTFEAIDETLEKTTLVSLEEGQLVNLERALRLGDEVGGHLVSGHIFGVARILEIIGSSFTLSCSPAWIKYFFEKGFVALDGVSLTLGSIDLEEASFTVHLIPETLTRTTWGHKKVGDRVNVEIDAHTFTIVETLERLTR